MGRSVSTPCNAVAVTYRDVTEIEDAEQFEYEVIEDLREYAKTLWPSLTECDKWIGREDHAVLENGHAYIGVSDYCGLAAFWLVPKDDRDYGESLARQWCEQVSAKFIKAFGNLRCIGRLSNGEAVYQKGET